MATTVNISLDQRLTAAECASVLSIGKSTFRKRVAEGIYPAPDVREGQMPFWFAATIRPLVTPSTQNAGAIDCAGVSK
jgi:hypothetical protein